MHFTQGFFGRGGGLGFRVLNKEWPPRSANCRGPDTERTCLPMCDQRSENDVSEDRVSEELRDNGVLNLFFCDPMSYPWTVDEIGREIENSLAAVDSVGRLTRPGCCIVPGSSCSRRAPRGARISWASAASNVRVGATSQVGRGALPRTSVRRCRVSLTHPRSGLSWLYPPCTPRRQGCEAVLRGGLCDFKGSYQLGGLCTIPRASGTCEGNWLARSAARRIGL